MHKRLSIKVSKRHTARYHKKREQKFTIVTIGLNCDHHNIIIINLPRPPLTVLWGTMMRVLPRLSPMV